MTSSKIRLVSPEGSDFPWGIDYDRRIYLGVPVSREMFADHLDMIELLEDLGDALGEQR